MNSNLDSLKKKYASAAHRPLPLYELLKRHLLEEIRSRPAGEEFLPTQEALAAEFNLSRNTVRRALRELTNDGYLQATPRLGTRIRRRTVPVTRPAEIPGAENATVGLLLTNNVPTDARPVHAFPWQLADALEKEFTKHGLQLRVFDTRRNQHFWLHHPAALYRELRTQRITWIAAAVYQEAHYLLRNRMFAFLRSRGITIVPLWRDLDQISHPRTWIFPQTAGVAINALGPLRQTLENLFANYARFFYVAPANKDNYAFCRARCQVVEDFAAERCKFFHKLLIPVVHGELDEAAWESAYAMLDPHRPGVVFCANDAYARKIYAALLARHKNCGRLTIIGYDGEPHCPFSSFVCDFAAAAKAFLRLYALHRTENSPAQTSCAIINDLFIDRRPRPRSLTHDA